MSVEALELKRERVRPVQTDVQHTTTQAIKQTRPRFVPFVAFACMAMLSLRLLAGSLARVMKKLQSRLSLSDNNVDASSSSTSINQQGETHKTRLQRAH